MARGDGTDKVARFRDETYWARPVPGYGDATARILIVGLAPAAHGGNRTGRVFTGDESGEFLWRALHAQGLSDRAVSRRAGDGLSSTTCGSPPPSGAPHPPTSRRPDEQHACRPYLVRELQLLPELRVILAARRDRLGRGAAEPGGDGPRDPEAQAPFGHGAEAASARYTLLGSYHPSQQNTFTGRLTQPMLRQVLARARELAGLPPA